jgi:hypothetical protein
MELNSGNRKVNMVGHTLIVFRRVILSIIFGFSISFTLAVQFFGYDNFSTIDRLFLLVVPALSMASFVYYFLPLVEGYLGRIPASISFILFGVALFAAFVLMFSVVEKSVLLSIAILISLLGILFVGVIPTAPYVCQLIEAKHYPRLFFGWLFAAIVTFFVVSILGNFYFKPFQIICLTLSLQLGIGVIGYSLIQRMNRFAQTNIYEFAIVVTLFLLNFTFVCTIFEFGGQFPNLFTPSFFILKNNLLAVFLAASVFSLPWQAWVLYKLKSGNLFSWLKQTRFYTFVNENFFGILLAFPFFSIYFLIASVLNHPSFDVDDIFFDADGLNWRIRLTTDNWRDFYWRSVHSFVELLLKPPIDLVAKFLKGDTLSAALFVVAFTGALCVFLCWMFIRRATGNPVYASLVATILGMSASHLVFGSLIETYIFLAASIILFYVLLLEDKPFSLLVFASLPAIGITITNFAQNVIALFILKPNFKLIWRYVLIVGVLFVQLSLLNNLLYPNAHPFIFLPSGLLAEQQNIFPFSMLRFQALARNFLFYNVVAPNPILYFGDIPFTQFRFFKPEINRLSAYDTSLQTFTAWFWLVLLALAVVCFFIKFKQNKHLRFSFAFLACILLNVGLHLRYGKELFLYSPNWTYALILLLGLAWGKLANNKWFLAVLLIFLFFLMANNGALLYTLVSVSALPPN